MGNQSIRYLLTWDGEMRDGQNIRSYDIWYFDSREEAEEQLAVQVLKQAGER